METSGRVCTDGSRQLKLLEKIISGGQTGIDRLALDIALELAIPLGGYCPLGRRSEEGVIPLRYPLVETPSRNYQVRTERNIADSDGSLLVTLGPPRGGSALTVRLAKRLKKPLYHIDTSTLALIDPVPICVEWLCSNRVRVLNVAGPRQSRAQGLPKTARPLLTKIFQLARNPAPRNYLTNVD